jgi:hypothetical protein
MLLRPDIGRGDKSDGCAKSGAVTLRFRLDTRGAFRNPWLKAHVLGES